MSTLSQRPRHAASAVPEHCSTHSCPETCTACAQAAQRTSHSSSKGYSGPGTGAGLARAGRACTEQPGGREAMQKGTGAAWSCARQAGCGEEKEGKGLEKKGKATDLVEQSGGCNYKTGGSFRGVSRRRSKREEAQQGSRGEQAPAAKQRQQALETEVERGVRGETTAAPSGRPGGSQPALGSKKSLRAHCRRRCCGQQRCGLAQSRCRRRRRSRCLGVRTGALLCSLAPVAKHPRPQVVPAA